ncbi:UDP-glucose--hexose-1-phosphate uridylyltransferase [Macrococcoides bohemicum]|nr:UDP-glucose--hexose-1-phosphate uridylyltransferase [Macrococcus bohemicus]QYA44862.1 UDP-glucose--hexose-1-phosphate uridylyltransferase [Macrococcus bohemicus]
MGRIMSLEIKINTLIHEVMTKLSLNERDFIYYKNKVSYLCGLEPADNNTTELSKSIPELLDDIITLLVAEQKIEDIFDFKEILSAQIMDTFIPVPSVIETQFYQQYDRSPIAATDYFFNLSTVSNYIQSERIKNNIHYKTPTAYGDLDITINLSKPEKDPEEIKKLKKLEAAQQSKHYPKCMLCVENEGYAGRINYPARSNHRIVELNLNQEPWYFQYSPYAYYNEHAIILNKEHSPMIINKNTFIRLIEFVEQFPHYFIGSNADLPIVGGSMLTHDHYQAGRYKFAMDDAPSIYDFHLPQFANVSFNILKWPLSVIRLTSNNKEEIIAAATHILTQWQQYTDESIGLIAETDQPHNTITPIARFKDGNYELDLVLRNNRTTEQYPLGIFHPHQQHHHIKKENIGLIEVMGLAVLPARLKQDIQDIKAHLKNNALPYNPIHQEWVSTFDIKDEDINQYVDRALGHKFAEILQDAGVFKHLDEFKRFLLKL